MRCYKMKKSSKIIFLTGTRAEYGLMKPTLIELQKNFKVKLIVTGTHLLKKYGYSVQEIYNDKFEISSKIKISPKSNDLKNMADTVGLLIPKITSILKKEMPDLVLIEGDRGEQLSMAIAASFMNIPIAHTSGGYRSKTIDDLTRNAITKFSNLHLAPSKASAQRIKNMNEESWRIHVVGPPINLNFKKIDILKKLKIQSKEPILLLIQHPVSNQYDQSRTQIKTTLSAITSLKYNTIIIYPNSDAGSKEIIEEIEKIRNLPYIHIFKNLKNNDFMNLMSCADLMIGNSSAGIVEAPFFKLPVINLGIRQQNRECGDNVLNSNHNLYEIKKKIGIGLNKNFRKNLKYNPYKLHKPSEKLISKILLNIKIDQKFISK